ncbi:MAG: ATP-binding protein [Chitinophagaceae bacterium]
MQDQNHEIYIFIIIAIILGLLLVGFIVTILFLYQRRQHQQEQELARLKDIYDRELLRSQLEIQEGTLKTIAQELHDNIGQMLSVVKLSMSVLPIEKEHPAQEMIKHSQQVLNKAILDLSDLTKSMHTDRIVDVGLADSIRFEIASIKRTGILQVDFSVIGEEVSFDGQKSIFLFRMFQEMMNNIFKHSKATEVNVSLVYSADDIFIMEVEDNGQGFDVEEKRQTASASGVGLKSIFSRAELIGAAIDVKSSPGKGTRIVVELSYPNN